MPVSRDRSTWPPWMREAQYLMGIAEVVGPGSHPKILSWARNFAPWVKAYFTDDDIPWCALFVSECLRAAGITPTRDVLSARTYREWGQRLTGPAFGAILCFTRPGGNHVGFYLGQRVGDGALRVRGGNQSNRVSDIWIDRGRLVAMRWPAAFPLPVPEPILLAADGQPLSRNEA